MYILNKKSFCGSMTKKSYLHDRFFVSNQNFTTEQFKILKNSIFSRLFLPKLSNFMFFKVKWQAYVTNITYSIKTLPVPVQLSLKKKV